MKGIVAAKIMHLIMRGNHIKGWLGDHAPACQPACRPVMQHASLLRYHCRIVRAWHRDEGEIKPLSAAVNHRYFTRAFVEMAGALARGNCAIVACVTKQLRRKATIITRRGTFFLQPRNATLYILSAKMAWRCRIYKHPPID